MSIVQDGPIAITAITPGQLISIPSTRRPELSILLLVSSVEETEVSIDCTLVDVHGWYAGEVWGTGERVAVYDGGRETGADCSFVLGPAMDERPILWR